MTSRAQPLFQTYGKVFAGLLMMALGILLPGMHGLSILIQYLLMALLFFAFLEIEFKPGSLHKSTVWILAANLGIPFLSYWLLSHFDRELALVAFVTSVGPTAISAPVIISFVDGHVEYVATAALITNVAMALIVPFVLPLLGATGAHILVWDILWPVLVVMFVPLAVARLIPRLPPGAQTFVGKGKALSFPAWLAILFVISAKASDFLRASSSSPVELIEIAAVAFVSCIVNFALGAWIGGPGYRQEASQSLGQKNSSFTIWLALTFLSPLVALGPTFYMLFHNLYNAFQIYTFEKRRSRS